MQHFNLIFDECEKLNKSLDSTFIDSDLFFIGANISEISYGLNENAIVFCYYPERYEYGKIMLLKGVLVQLAYDKKRQYSIDELNSFFSNNCEFYNVSNSFVTLEEWMVSIKKLMEYLDKNKSDWEQKFIFYKSSITPKW
jgi:hypothetical protein